MCHKYFKVKKDEIKNFYSGEVGSSVLICVMYTVVYIVVVYIVVVYIFVSC